VADLTKRLLRALAKAQYPATSQAGSEDVPAPAEPNPPNSPGLGVPPEPLPALGGEEQGSPGASAAPPGLPLQEEDRPPPSDRESLPPALLQRTNSPTEALSIAGFVAGVWYASPSAGDRGLLLHRKRRAWTPRLGASPEGAAQALP
jgi:hypothetical protein